MISLLASMTLMPWQNSLLIGAAFGLLHALDADHLATLGGLAVAGRSSTTYAAHWAVGHALALSGLGSVILGLGLWGLTAISTYAEFSVAILLVALGLQVLYSNCRRGHRTEQQPRLRRRTAGLLMGVLHGGAGSAGVLALLPLAAYQSSAVGMLYLATFSFGVGCGALLFATAFGHLSARAKGRMGVFLPIVIGACAALTGVGMLASIGHGMG